MIRLFLLAAVACALAKPPPCRVRDIDDPTEAYVRVLRHLSTVRHALIADTLDELAAKEAATNPFDSGLVTMTDSEGLAFRKILERRLAEGVDWESARAKLHDLARELRGGEAKREDVNRETRPLLAAKPIVDDLMYRAGLSPQEAQAKITSAVGKDGALYVMFSTALFGPQKILRYDGKTVTPVELPAGSYTRDLFTTPQGDVVAACLTGDKLSVTDLKSGVKVDYPLSKKLQAHVAKHGFQMSREQIPRAHFVGRSIAMTWRDARGPQIAYIGPKLAKPTFSFFTLHASPDGKHLYAYGTDSATRQLVVQDLVSGEELLRVKSTMGLKYTVAEDGAGNFNLVTVNCDNYDVTWRTFPGKKKVKYRYPGYLGVEPVFARDAKGGLSLVFTGQNDGMVWKAGAPAPHPIPALPYPLRFFNMVDGSIIAIGHSRESAEDKGYAVNLSTGETMKLPLGLVDTHLQDVHELPGGRVIAVVGLTRGHVLKTAGLVQVYGPAN